MAKITFNITPDPTLEAVDRAIEAVENAKPRRPYLGMSSIGRPCERALWYGFRGVSAVTFPASTLKKFEDGHEGEAMQARRLQMVPGVELHIVDPETGEQFEFEDFGGHFSGHSDGVMRGLLQAPKKWHVWEHKQVAEKKFNEFKKLLAEHGEKRTLRLWDETYHAQAQMYMRYARLERHYITVSLPGGRDSLSARTEYDKEFADQMVARAERIIFAKEPPAKIGDASHWKCKQCDHFALCHEQAPPRKNCRTCVFATPVNEPSTLNEKQGKWVCEFAGKNEIPFDVQLEGCPEHLFIPPLISYAKPVDCAGNWVLYEKPDGRSFINVNETGKDDARLPELPSVYTSAELAALHPSMIGDQFLDGLKDELGAEVVA